MCAKRRQAVTQAERAALRDGDVPTAYGGDEREAPGEALWPRLAEAGSGGPEGTRPVATYAPDRLDEIPNEPGVYLMRDADGEVIYIGKSVALRTRVRSYFSGEGDGRLSARFLRPKIAGVDIITTRSEKEALLLEIALIQHHNPRYNFRLTDDKSYYSIKLDRRKEFPRLEFVRTRNVRPGHAAEVEYFGPFHSSEAVKSTISMMQKIFPLRTCSDHVMRNRTRPCILHEIDKCCAPCVLPVTKEDYAELMRGTRLFLQGKSGEVARQLRARMEALSEALEFERAARVRDQIAAVERTLERQTVAAVSRVARDAVAMCRQAATVCFVVLHYREAGLVESEHYLERDLGDDDDEMMRRFVMQYYARGGEIPGEVWTSVEPEDAAQVAEILDELRARRAAAEGDEKAARRKMRLSTPARGEKARVVALARQNAEQLLERELSGRKTREETLLSLKAKLGLPRLPRHIDCFDISTFQGAENVAALVVFRDGEPAKSQYRRYKIRTIADGQADDFASMREVLERRYRRALDEGADLPDLVVIDGGKGQLGMALEVFRQLGIEGVPIVGLAKSRLKSAAGGGGEEMEYGDVALVAGAKPVADKYRTEERVFLPGRKNPVLFRRDAAALYLLQRLRDETHRFVITYHRDRRRKGALRSALDEIPGVGPVRRRALLRHFGSLSAVRAATPDQLREAPRMTAALAERIHAALADETGDTADAGEASDADD